MNDEKLEYMEEDIYGNTYRALELLLINSRTMQRQIREMSLESSLREICTVRVAGARRSGHSSALIKLALEYFSGAVFISTTHRIAMDLLRIFANYCKNESIVLDKIDKSFIKLDNGSKYNFLSTGCLRSLRGIQTEAVVVDGISDIERGIINEVYDIGSACMSQNPYKFFIFVG